jgi:hypothetical protein
MDGEEIYARDIGLVHYKRNISGKLQLEFDLESRVPVSGIRNRIQ